MAVVYHFPRPPDHGLPPLIFSTTPNSRNPRRWGRIMSPSPEDFTRNPGYSSQTVSPQESAGPPLRSTISLPAMMQPGQSVQTAGELQKAAGNLVRGGKQKFFDRIFSRPRVLPEVPPFEKGTQDDVSEITTDCSSDCLANNDKEPQEAVEVFHNGRYFSWKPSSGLLKDPSISPIVQEAIANIFLEPVDIESTKISLKESENPSQGTVPISEVLPIKNSPVDEMASLDAAPRRIDSRQNDDSFVLGGLSRHLTQLLSDPGVKSNERIRESRDEERIKSLERRVEELEAELRDKNAALEILFEGEDLDRRVRQRVTGRSGTPYSRQGANSTVTDAARILRDEMDVCKQIADEFSTFMTPRGILIAKLLRRLVTQQALENSEYIPTHYDQRMITTNDLARFTAQLSRFQQLVIPQSTQVLVCSRCGIPKFLETNLNLLDPFIQAHTSLVDRMNPGPSRRGTPDTSQPHLRPSFSEFPENTMTQCCDLAICKVCYLSGIITNIKTDWASNLDLDDWIGCPEPTCKTPLGLRYNIDVSILFDSLDDRSTRRHATLFQRAGELRQALQHLEPAPTLEAIQCSLALHEHLVRHGRAHDFFDQRVTINPSSATFFSVDSDESDPRTLQVPLFPSFFARPSRNSNQMGNLFNPGPLLLRECIICAEDVSDLLNGTAADEAHWARDTAAFRGDWMWQVRGFPARDMVPGCAGRHTFDVCRTCMARHLSAQLDTRSHADLNTLGLTCPAPGCGRMFEYKEVRVLADAPTFARYDRMHMLAHLATQPGFRWCLRPECDSGAVYEVNADADDEGLGNCVACEACDLRMCFAHQTAWHAGQTCAQVNADAAEAAARGTADAVATQDFLRRNTKQCPGCGASIIKNGGCWHMTCRQCSYEFCWDCLVDWGRILVSGHHYVREAHATGCRFRPEGAPQPTQVTD